MSVLIIFGAATAEEVRTAVERNPQRRWTTIEMSHVDLEHSEESVQAIAKRYPQADYNVGIAETKLRQQVAAAAQRAGLKAATIIDPAAFIDPSATIKEGCFIAANAVISSRASLSSHVLVHFNATVGHNAKVGPGTVILPGARISGHCQLGAAVMIGSNAFLYQKVQIGDEAKVDAMTYVHEDIPAHRIVSVRRMI